VIAALTRDASRFSRDQPPSGARLAFHLPNRSTWIGFLLRQINPWLRDSQVFFAGLNTLDDGLTAISLVFAQNWFFVLRKC